MPTKMAESNGETSPPPEAGSSTTRLQRNLAEKQRRDKLNGFISELATIVPMVSMASKRLDKTSILRLSAAHLRISQSPLGNSKHSKRFKWCPNFLNTEQIREILEAVDGFLLVTTSCGKIIYISQTVENFLGHQNIEMIGHAICSFVHPSDVDTVRSQLKELCEKGNQKKGSSNLQRCSFYCRMRERSQPRSDVLTYQFVHIVGHMEPGHIDSDVENVTKGKGNDTKASSSPSNSLFKAFVKVVHSNPYNELSLADAIEDEYVTRHSLDGTIIFADHRIATITGHLPHEVFGMNAYEYICQEDIPIALFAHQLMFSNNNGTGMIVYKLRTRDEAYVYLKSTGYLQFDRSSTQVDHFVCVNRQLSESAGDEELKNFIDRFTPHINGSSTSSLYESIKAIQVSGLKVPDSCLAAKNGHSVDNKYSFLSLTSDQHGDPVSAKSTSVEQVIKGLKSKGKESKMVSLLSSKSAKVNVQGLCGAYSKKAQEKMVLEETSHEQGFSNHSPLTAESSLSGNSPLSDDVGAMSPTGPMESIDNLLTTVDNATCELPSATLLGGDSISYIECEESSLKNLLVYTGSLSDGQQVSVYQQDKDGTLLSTAVLVLDADTVSAMTCQSSSPAASSYISSIDMGENSSATHSDSVFSSISDPSDKGSDTC